MSEKKRREINFYVFLIASKTTALKGKRLKFSRKKWPRNQPILLISL